MPTPSTEQQEQSAKLVRAGMAVGLGADAPKPYTKTSYFILMIAVIFGGAGMILGASMYLPNVAFLNDEQRGQILSIMFQAWGALSGITVGGNVAARGALTLIKQWLQNELEKKAAGIAEQPKTLNVATTGDVTTGDVKEPANPVDDDVNMLGFRDETVPDIIEPTQESTPVEGFDFSEPASPVDEAGPALPLQSEVPVESQEEGERIVLSDDELKKVAQYTAALLRERA